MIIAYSPFLFQEVLCMAESEAFTLRLSKVSGSNITAIPPPAAAGFQINTRTPDNRPVDILNLVGNYSGRHHLDATNKMILYPLSHKSI